MAISKIVNNKETFYTCLNVDTKPVGARPNSVLWVEDTNTWYLTADGNAWIQTGGNNSIFSFPKSW